MQTNSEARTMIHRIAIASLTAALFLLSFFFGCSQAADEASPPRIKATNVVQLREQVGKQVTVYGRIARTSTSSRGKHQFLNFYDDALSVICFSEDVSKFDGSGPAELYKDKDVELTGKLELYQSKLQIKLRDPAQIKLAGSAPRPKEPADDSDSVELKKIGTDTWLSPAGLRYEGRDPDGLTRVEHVLRHARDIPDRDGPHGVFDGGPERVFGVIDEAWRRAQRDRIRPEVERDRSVYTIPMGKRIGFLGGQTGARKDHPPLFKVFLVIETRTKSVITAFPR